MVYKNELGLVIQATHGPLQQKVHIIPCKNSIDASHVAALFSKEVFHLIGVLKSITLECNEHFVCYGRILWKLLSGCLHFFSAFNSQVDGHSKVRNRFLGNLLKSSEGGHLRKWEFVISQDKKPPF